MRGKTGDEGNAGSPTSSYREGGPRSSPASSARGDHTVRTPHELQTAAQRRAVASNATMQRPAGIASSARQRIRCCASRCQACCATRPALAESLAVLSRAVAERKRQLSALPAASLGSASEQIAARSRSTQALGRGFATYCYRNAPLRFKAEAAMVVSRPRPVRFLPSVRADCAHGVQHRQTVPAVAVCEGRAALRLSRSFARAQRTSMRTFAAPPRCFLRSSRYHNTHDTSHVRTQGVVAPACDAGGTAALLTRPRRLCRQGVRLRRGAQASHARRRCSNGAEPSRWAHKLWKTRKLNADLLPRSLASITSLADESSRTLAAHATTEWPSGRVGATFVSAKGKVYLWGGRGGKDMGTFAGETGIWAFDPSTASWAQHETNGEQPEPRSFHTMAACGVRTPPSLSTPTPLIIWHIQQDNLYLHAGCPASGRLAQLHSLDLTNWTWTRLPDAPEPARGGTVLTALPACTASTPLLARYGGFAGYEVGGLDIYDVEAQKWSTIDEQVEGGGEGPGKRSVQSFVGTDGALEYKDKVVVALLSMGEREAAPKELGHDGAGFVRLHLGSSSNLCALSTHSGVTHAVSLGCLGPPRHQRRCADLLLVAPRVFGALKRPTRAARLACLDARRGQPGHHPWRLECEKRASC